MDYYDYRDWITWPEHDVREYASEIAADLSLTSSEVDHLHMRMMTEAGHSLNRQERMGPIKMHTDMEVLFRSLAAFIHRGVSEGLAGVA